MNTPPPGTRLLLPLPDGLRAATWLAGRLASSLMGLPADVATSGCCRRRPSALPDPPVARAHTHGWLHLPHPLNLAAPASALELEILSTRTKVYDRRAKINTGQAHVWSESTRGALCELVGCLLAPPVRSQCARLRLRLAFTLTCRSRCSP